jgi:ribosomal protein S18 acetylase RimI-like enzyme
MVMEEFMQNPRVNKLDEFNYYKLRGKIVDLYLHAFTTGEYAQYIAPETAESTLDEMIRNGFGNMAFIGDKLVGVLIAFPLKKDPEFPWNVCSDIPRDRSLYIAEVMVHSDYRGKGIASRLVADVLRQAAGTYSCAVIRVWERNVPALSLYEKFGFIRAATITQEKTNLCGDELEMKKIYLIKNLEDNELE